MVGIVLLAAAIFSWAQWSFEDGGSRAADASVREPTGTFVGDVTDNPAVVWAVGDGADGGDDAKALAERIAAGEPDRFLYLGDVYQRGTDEEFEENYASVYGELAEITAPTPGNHDWRNHTEGYDPYWRDVYGRPPPHFYSFEAGGWQLISLNSEADLEPDGAQVRWLEKQLRGGGTCRLAFWHKPRYSAGKHGDDEDVDPFWEALEGRAAIVVNGHDHDMQRLKPIDGITSFVSGAGGKSLYEIDPSDERVAFRNDTDFGALRLVLQRGRADYAFVTTDGRTLDRGTVSCDP